MAMTGRQQLREALVTAVGGALLMCALQCMSDEPVALFRPDKWDSVDHFTGAFFEYLMLRFAQVQQELHVHARCPTR